MAAVDKVEGGEGMPPRLLDITSLAEHLSVNARHVRRLVAERRIPFIRWGRLIRFDPVEIRVDRRLPSASWSSGLNVTASAYGDLARWASPFTRRR